MRTRNGRGHGPTNTAPPPDRFGVVSSAIFSNAESVVDGAAGTKTENGSYAVRKAVDFVLLSEDVLEGAQTVPRISPAGRPHIRYESFRKGIRKLTKRFAVIVHRNGDIMVFVNSMAVTGIA